MIGKISARGSRVAGLLYYLYGPGRNEAHTNPHLVAGWRDPAELEPALRQDMRRDFGPLAGLLQQPHAALGPRVRAAGVALLDPDRPAGPDALRSGVGAGRSRRHAPDRAGPALPGR